jgi:hypothetical protein
MGAELTTNGTISTFRVSGPSLLIGGNWALIPMSRRRPTASSSGLNPNASLRRFFSSSVGSNSRNFIPVSWIARLQVET